MEKNVYLMMIGALIILASGCAENQTRIGEGAGMGGLLGAAAGGIIGHQSGNGVTGALIGGAAGAAGGAMVGSQINKPTNAQYAPQQPVSPVTMQQVIDWTNQGVSSDQIVARIQSSNSVYALTADDVGYLRRHGVSQRVIEVMQTAR